MPAPSCRTKPARTSSLCEATWASVGASLRVGMKALEARTTGMVRGLYTGAGPAVPEAPRPLARRASPAARPGLGGGRARPGLDRASPSPPSSWPPGWRWECRPLRAAAAAPGESPEAVAAGQAVFAFRCTPCHRDVPLPRRGGRLVGGAGLPGHRPAPEVPRANMPPFQGTDEDAAGPGRLPRRARRRTRPPALSSDASRRQAPPPGARSAAMRSASPTSASSSSSAFIRFTILPALKSSPTPPWP